MLQGPGCVACWSRGACVIFPFNKVSNVSKQQRRGSQHLPAAVRPEAEPLCRRATNGFEAQLGPNHEGTLICLRNFAGLLQEQGRLDEAGSSKNQVIDLV